MPYYQTERALSEYLLLHYGAHRQIMPFDFGPVAALDFPMRCVSECLLPSRLPPAARALDLGCAVGRSTFELARNCVQVVGIDSSPIFIDAACHLQKHGQMDFGYVEEGELTLRATAAVPPEIQRQRVVFKRGDAQELGSDHGAFDVLLMANLIDRLPAPGNCLRLVHRLLNPGGQLIITSPYTWLTEFTPREQWLGGFLREEKLVKTLDTMKEILSPHFALLSRKDLPFLIREHARKFQWSVAEATVWLRKG